MTRCLTTEQALYMREKTTSVVITDSVATNKTIVWQKNENLVLGSWLVSFHSDNSWKWIYHLPCLQQTTASHQNQRVRCFTRSGGFRSWDERCAFAVLVWHGDWLQPRKWCDCVYCEKPFCIPVCDELMQFSPGSLHRHCESLEILDFYEASPRHSNGFSILDNSGYTSCDFRNTKVSFFQNAISLSYLNVAVCDIFWVSTKCDVNILLCIHVTCCL